MEKNQRGSIKIYLQGNKKYSKIQQWATYTEGRKCTKDIQEKQEPKISWSVCPFARLLLDSFILSSRKTLSILNKYDIEYSLLLWKY